MLHILLDTSGSMVEDSRNHAALYVLLSLRRFFQQKGISVPEFTWAEEIQPLERIGDIPWEGGLDVASFHSFYQEHSPILLISDGDFPIELDFHHKDQCFLLLLGEVEGAIQYAFPHGRLWRAEDLNQHLSLFFAKFGGELSL